MATKIMVEVVMRLSSGNNTARRRDASPVSDETGATTLEWVLLLAAIAVPSYWIVRLAIMTLVGHYQLVTTMNGLPFP